MWETDLLPFRMLVRDGIPAVLSGHLSFPNVTGDGAPASISTFFKQHILRERLSFPGIVVTDDLYMGGAVEYGVDQGWDFPEVVKRAILAGNDIVMFSRTPAFNGEIWETLITAYREEPEFRARVDASLRRILRVKLAYLRDERRVPITPDAAAIRALMRTEEAQAFFLDQAARSVTVVRDDGLPLSRDNLGSVLLVGKDPTFFSVGRRFLPSADVMRFEQPAFYFSSAADRSRFSRLAERYDTIIFLLSDPGTGPAGRSGVRRSHHRLQHPHADLSRGAPVGDAGGGGVWVGTRELRERILGALRRDPRPRDAPDRVAPARTVKDDGVENGSNDWCHRPRAIPRRK